MKNAIPAEPFDCLMYFYGAERDLRIRCTIRFDGHIDTAALSRAVMLSVRAIPVLGCVFNRKKHNWVRRPFTPSDFVQTVSVGSGDGAAVESLQLSSFNMFLNPQIKVLTVRQPDTDTLCISINHMVCDGSGFKHYVYLLAGLYTACAGDPSYETCPLVAGRRRFARIIRNLNFREAAGIFKRNPVSARVSRLQLPLSGGAGHPFIVTERLDSALFSSVHRFASSCGASINDVLIAAYARVLCRITGSDTVHIPCPVDLRKYLKPGQDAGLCNLTGTYRCCIPVHTEDPFKATLSCVSEQMRIQKAGTYCLRGPLLFQLLYMFFPFFAVHFLFSRSFTVPVISYTNIGRIDGRRAAFGTVPVTDLVISTAVKKVPYFQVTVSTCNEICTLSSCLQGTEDNRRTVCGILSGIREELEKCAGPSV